jgi:hypothetical protein
MLSSAISVWIYCLIFTFSVGSVQGKFVTPVTLYMTKHINVTKLAPFALQRHLVPNIGLGIVIYATGLFLFKRVFKII